ncbi:hypothetical protein CA12_43760 [Alienimonas californiensis]|uniref:Secreted protein n=1 Tax=Alienimonas californiensis TaxID=2527989 RepID=A0A517PFV2_9PLAN|nr:hypothetical protein CA12_43760 [Alienimonas californiensis]
MTWATLLAMVVCQLPAPLPVPAAAIGKDRTELYPCRDRACGCGSAEACWTGCCCFTNVQKVAWARANNVAIPAFVHDAAKQETRDVKQEAAAKPQSSCCAKPAAKASCCGGADDCCDAKSEPTATDTPAPPLPLGWAAQKCRGELAACGALPWALRPMTADAPTRPAFDWDRPRSVGAAMWELDPPTPPPRSGAAASLL